jgi:hypothetical protein
MPSLSQDSVTLGRTDWLPVATTTRASASTAFTQVDATDAKVTFTAPTNGEVEIVAQASVAAGTSTRYSWGLHDGTAFVADTNIPVAEANTFTVARAAWLLTGLTPGVEYTYWLAHARVLGTSTAETRIGGTNTEYGPLSLVARRTEIPVQVVDTVGWSDVILPSAGAADDDEFDDGTIDPAWVAQTVSGTAAWTEDGDVMACLFAGQTANDIAALLRPIPAGATAPLTVETAMRVMTIQTQVAMVGIVLTDGTGPTANCVWALLNFASNGVTYLRAYTGTLTAFSATSPMTSNISNVQVMPWMHVRVVWESTDTFSVWGSPTGTDGSWTSLGVASFAKTMTPTHMGLAVSTNGIAGSDRVGAFEYLRAIGA